MRARYILETGQWENIPLETGESGPDAHAGMPGMAMAQYAGSTPWTFIAGVSAARLGDFATAEAAEARLRASREKLEAAGNAYGAKPVAIMEKEVAALSQSGRGQTETAIRLAKEAVEIETSMSPPSGPPDPMKPALELYGELLLEAGRPGDAIKAFEESLMRTPLRTPSVLGLARAAAKAGDVATARQRYEQLAAMPGAAPTSAAAQEAQRFLNSTHD
jgi:predicted Zn-dependent protease